MGGCGIEIEIASVGELGRVWGLPYLICRASLAIRCVRAFNIHDIRLIIARHGRFVLGIWCSWLSHPLSMVLDAGGLRFESGFVHCFFSAVTLV